MIRIFIADDHPIVRHGLRELIDRQPDMQVVGEADDGHAVVHAPTRSSWDILILELSLPRLNGIEVVRRLRAAGPAPRVVVLSMHPEDQYAPRLLEEGAAAYLHKSTPPRELLRALRAVAATGTYARPEQAAAPGTEGAAQRLSAREHQIFMLIAAGRTVTDIAAELNLSVSTVSTHLSNVRHKLGARSIGDLVNYAHRWGLVE